MCVGWGGGGGGGGGGFLGSRDLGKWAENFAI